MNSPGRPSNASPVNPTKVGAVKRDVRVLQTGSRNTFQRHARKKYVTYISATAAATCKGETWLSARNFAQSNLRQCWTWKYTSRPRIATAIAVVITCFFVMNAGENPERVYRSRGWTDLISSPRCGLHL